MYDPVLVMLSTNITTSMSRYKRLSKQLVSTHALTMIKLIVLFAFVAICTSQSPDPDVGRTTCQLVESRKFRCETHYVKTADNYILTVHRIVNPNKEGQNLKVS